MKRFTLLFFCCMIISGLSAQENYYWYRSQKVLLQQDSSVFYVQSVITKDRGTALSRSGIAAALKLQDTAMAPLSEGGFVIRLTAKSGPAALFSRSDLSIGYRTPLLRNSRGGKMIILPRILLQLKAAHQIAEVLSLYPALTILKDKGYNTWLLPCKVQSQVELFRIMNELYEKHSSIVEWSEPEFYGDYRSTTLDPLYNNQYHLKNTGGSGGVAGMDINAEPAWGLTRGCNTIRVAVIDDGVEAHEDYAGRLLPGFTAGATSGAGAPVNGAKAHGTACTGIITATHNNNLGVAGVAPNVLILPVNIFPLWPTGGNEGGAVTNVEIAAAIDWAWDQGAADVLSNSWGGGAQSNALDAAINRARTLGRAGRGCAVVFSSGNEGGAVYYPGDLDGVITVGASNRAGNITSYSNRGPSMDLVAFSGNSGAGDITTTDRMGWEGETPGNYRTNFGGTSAACPQVSGVAALMISANPNLTEAQIRTILQNTASDMGASGFDNTYGFGRVNAYAAVLAALGVSGAPSIIGDGMICGNTGGYSINNFPPGATVTWEALDDWWSVSINTPNAPQTDVTVADYGIIRMQATMSLGCAPIVLQTTPVTVKMPYQIANIEFSSNGLGGGATLCNHAYDYDDYANTFSAYFTYSPPNQPINVEYRIVDMYGMVYNQVTIPNFIENHMYPLPPSMPAGYYNIEMRAIGACGLPSDWYEGSLEYSDNCNCFCSLSVVVSPNPTSNDLYVTIDNTKLKNLVPAKTETVSFTLYDLNQTRAVRQWSNTSGQKQYKLNIAGIKPGQYVLVVARGKEKKTSQVLIK